MTSAQNIKWPGVSVVILLYTSCTSHPSYDHFSLYPIVEYFLETQNNWHEYLLTGNRQLILCCCPLLEQASGCLRYQGSGIYRDIQKLTYFPACDLFLFYSSFPFCSKFCCWLWGGWVFCSWASCTCFRPIIIIIIIFEI